MSIILIIPKDLLDMYYFWTRVPRNAATYQIPRVPLFYRNFLQAREGGDGHNDNSSVFKINLKLSPCRKSDGLDLGNYAPITFCCHTI